MFAHRYYYPITMWEGFILDLKSFVYKHDEFTGELRLSKTKIITCLIFLPVFLSTMNLYLNDPRYINMNILILLFSALIVGLVFALPVYIIGLLICKFLYRDKFTIFKGHDNNQDNNIDFQNTKNNNYDFNPCPYDNAIRFKSAIEDNTSDLAEKILENWDKNDANYRYAYLIYEGMPPTQLSQTQLHTLLNQADKMSACDNSLKEWYRSTALEVIKLND